jgi:hypothetical protein
MCSLDRDNVHFAPSEINYSRVPFCVLHLSTSDGDIRASAGTLRATFEGKVANDDRAKLERNDER